MIRKKKRFLYATLLTKRVFFANGFKWCIIFIIQHGEGKRIDFKTVQVSSKTQPVNLQEYIRFYRKPTVPVSVRW